MGYKILWREKQNKRQIKLLRNLLKIMRNKL